MSGQGMTDEARTAHIQRHAEAVHRIVCELALGDEDPDQVDMGEVLGEALLTMTATITRLCMDNERPQAIRDIAVAILKEAKFPADHKPPIRLSRWQIVGG